VGPDVPGRWLDDVTERRLHVLYMTTQWPHPAEPVDGPFIREHALAAALYADVRVVHLLREPGKHGLYAVESFEDEGLPVRRVRYRRFPRPLSYIAFLIGALRTARSLTSDRKPDVIHAHSFLSAVPALVLGKLMRRPVVYTEHWTIFTSANPGTLSRLHDVLANAVIGRADLVLPVSDDLRRALAGRKDGRFEVVANVVDTELFHPGPRIANGTIRLLTVGLLSTERKGLDYLLQALAIVARGRTDVTLDVVGEGELRPGYEALASELGLGDIVRFHGYRDKQTIAAMMREADLFVLGSRFENNPCVVIEAMASGLPVVATRVGGVPELVTADVGIVAEPQSPESLAQAIERALDRLPSYDPASMSRAASERFSRNHVGAHLAGIYARLALNADT
jgi:glycosyltransferase involved in cell wall biosynthesis